MYGNHREGDLLSNKIYNVRYTTINVSIYAKYQNLYRQPGSSAISKLILLPNPGDYFIALKGILEN
jgi:hypothetical protein